MKKNTSGYTTINDLPKDVLWIIFKKVFRDVWYWKYAHNCYYDVCGSGGKCANPLNVKYKIPQYPNRSNSNDKEYFTHIEGWFSGPKVSDQYKLPSEYNMSDMVGCLIKVNDKFKQMISDRITFNIGCWRFKPNTF